MTRYMWVGSRKAEGFAVTDACAVAEVSKSGFYEWSCRVNNGPTDRELDDAHLANAIFDLHVGSDRTYGVPRITPALVDAGF